MRTRTRNWVAIVLVGGVGLSIAAFWPGAASGDTQGSQTEATAQDQPAGRPFLQFISRGFARFLGMRAELALTDDQKMSMREAIAAHRTELAPSIKEVVDKRRALRDAVLADNPSEAAIRSAADDLGKAIGNAAVGMSKVVGEVKNVLTTGQRQVIRKYQNDRETAVNELLDKIAAE